LTANAAFFLYLVEFKNQHTALDVLLRFSLN